MLVLTLMVTLQLDVKMAVVKIAYSISEEVNNFTFFGLLLNQHG